MKSLLALLVLSTCLAVSGCGYQLRGTAASGAVARDVYVKGPSWLVEEVKILVESAGGSLRKSSSEADGTVRYIDGKFDRRVISVDSRTGKEREIEISYSLYFELTDKAGELLLSDTRVHLLRDYTIDADAILGKVSEEEVLRDEMRRDAASQLMRRVESVLGS